MIIGFDFSEAVFMHAILYAQDTIVCNWAASVGSSYLKNFFQKFEIYIGNSDNYLENTKCTGGPFLDASESSSYELNQKGFDDGDDPFGQGFGMVWPFGKELWCNLEGQYMHMVAGMSDHVATALDSDSVSVCSVGVYGTKYVRSGDSVPETIEVSQGQS